MASPVVGGALAFLAGAAVSWLNYRLNRHFLKTNPSALAGMAVVRQLLNVAALVGVFFLSRVLPWGQIPPLVGVALGLTVPSILLSLHLAKLNDSLHESQKKGEDQHE